jgi:hypothetical protein
MTRTDFQAIAAAVIVSGLVAWATAPRAPHPISTIRLEPDGAGGVKAVQYEAGDPALDSDAFLLAKWELVDHPDGTTSIVPVKSVRRYLPPTDTLPGRWITLTFDPDTPTLMVPSDD